MTESARQGQASPIRIVLTVLVTAGAVAWLVHQIDLRAMAAHVRRAHVGIWLVAVALQLATTFLMARRWQLMLARDSADPGYGWALRIYLHSTFFGLFLPSAVGGDVYRGVALARRLGSLRAVTVNLFAERLVGAFAVCLLGVVGLALHRGLPPRVTIVVAVVCGGIMVSTALLAHPTPVGIVARCLERVRLGRIAATLRGAGEQLRGHLHSRAVTTLLALSLSQQLLSIAAVHACALATAIDSVGFVFFLLAMPVVWVLSLVPSLAGTGPREVSLFWFLTVAGVDDDRAAACAALLLATIVARALLGGVALLFPRAR